MNMIQIEPGDCGMLAQGSGANLGIDVGVKCDTCSSKTILKSIQQDLQI